MIAIIWMVTIYTITCFASKKARHCARPGVAMEIQSLLLQERRHACNNDKNAE